MPVLGQHGDLVPGTVPPHADLPLNVLRHRRERWGRFRRAWMLAGEWACQFLNRTICPRRDLRDQRAGESHQWGRAWGSWMQGQDRRPCGIGALGRWGLWRFSYKIGFGNLPLCVSLRVSGKNPNKPPLSILNITGAMQCYFWPVLTLSKENVYADNCHKNRRDFCHQEWVTLILFL